MQASSERSHKPMWESNMQRAEQQWTTAFVQLIGWYIWPFRYNYKLSYDVIRIGNNTGISGEFFSFLRTQLITKENEERKNLTKGKNRVPWSIPKVFHATLMFYFSCSKPDQFQQLPPAAVAEFKTKYLLEKCKIYFRVSVFLRDFRPFLRSCVDGNWKVIIRVSHHNSILTFSYFPI